MREIVAFVCTMLLVGAVLAGWLSATTAAVEAVDVLAVVLVVLCVLAVVVALAVGCFRLIDILGMAQFCVICNAGLVEDGGLNGCLCVCLNGDYVCTCDELGPELSGNGTT